MQNTSTIIATERLILRAFTLQDALAVYEFGSNKEVQKYTGDILLQSVEEATAIIKNVWFADYQNTDMVDGQWCTKKIKK